MPARSLCWDCRSISIHSLEIARPSSASDALANRLLNSYRANHSDDWNWFENVLAYSNARLPQALIRAGMRAANEEMVSAGLEALDWLVTIQRCDVKGHFVPIGSQGFYSKKTRKGPFRPATRRSMRGRFGMLAGLSGHGKGTLAQRSVVSLQLVPGRQRSSDRALRSGYRRLSRRAASRPGK